MLLGIKIIRVKYIYERCFQGGNEMKVRMEFTYRTPKGAEMTCFSEEMKVPKALLLTEDLERTGRLKKITYVDKHDTTWSMKELQRHIEELKTEVHDIILYFDGGFDPETNQSGLGCVLYYKQNNKSFRLRKNALVEELKTNNEAEYAALHLALQELHSLEAHHIPITIIGDSNVVINQLRGEWPCYEFELSRWADRIDAKLEKLGMEPEYVLVSRNKNKEADQLASQALRKIEVVSTKEI